jgi:FixJ family two-component response regulator
MARQRNVVAIIDDDEMMRDSLERLLSTVGYRPELFASAEQFLLDASKSEASCLVVDINLGDISGVELAHELSASGFKFPIIFITGSGDEIIRRQAIEFGCIAYLQKPFPASQMIEAITKATGIPPT